MNSFAQAGAPAPWGQLPTGQQPWGGGEQWSAAQQAPWRMSPWASQGMPQGSAPTAPAAPQFNAQTYMPQGTSSGVSGFDPLQAGGNFYPGLLNPQQQQQQPMQPPAAQQQWHSTGTGGGQVYSSPQAARTAVTANNNDAASGGMGFQNWEPTGPQVGTLGGHMSSMEAFNQLYRR